MTARALVVQGLPFGKLARDEFAEQFDVGLQVVPDRPGRGLRRIHDSLVDYGLPGATRI